MLATNPIFPKVATESRIRWAGLQPEDFELYTTYEKTCHCKPNPAYYTDIPTVQNPLLVVRHSIIRSGRRVMMQVSVFCRCHCLPFTENFGEFALRLITEPKRDF